MSVYLLLFSVKEKDQRDGSKHLTTLIKRSNQKDGSKPLIKKAFLWPFLRLKKQRQRRNVGNLNLFFLKMEASLGKKSCLWVWFKKKQCQRKETFGNLNLSFGRHSRDPKEEPSKKFQKIQNATVLRKKGRKGPKRNFWNLRTRRGFVNIPWELFERLTVPKDPSVPFQG